MSKKFDDIDNSDLPEELKAIIKAATKRGVKVTLVEANLDDNPDNIDEDECDCLACRARKEHGMPFAVALLDLQAGKELTRMSWDSNQYAFCKGQEFFKYDGVTVTKLTFTQDDFWTTDWKPYEPTSTTTN
jgi:hypothetical protein